MNSQLVICLHYFTDCSIYYFVARAGVVKGDPVDGKTVASSSDVMSLDRRVFEARVSERVFRLIRGNR